MKKLLRGSNNEPPALTAFRTTFALFAAIALTLVFWSVTAPVAKAREMSPRDQIQSQLPQSKTLGSASKREVLDAVCAAVKKYRKDAPQIVRTAVEARKEIRKDIERTALQCLGKDDCQLLRQTVDDLISGSPDDAAELREIAIRFAPDCMEGGGRGNDRGEGNFENAPSNQNPPPGGTTGGGGGGFNPEEGRCQVCHTDGKSGKRMTLTISCNAVPAHLRHGDTEGPCPVTQTQNP